MSSAPQGASGRRRPPGRGGCHRRPPLAPAIGARHRRPPSALAARPCIGWFFRRTRL